jgi:hypothetical protein
VFAHARAATAPMISRSEYCVRKFQTRYMQLSSLLR